MNAFHTIWSRPGSALSYVPEDFNIVTAVLSALMWQKTNGRISMVCDRSVADFLYTSGLSPAWNEILPILDSIPPSIDAKTYWAGGKLFALKNFHAPIVGIDTDFIVWEKLTFPEKLCVIHKEELLPESYPDLPDFLKFSEDMDFRIPASNTAFFYIGDNEFLKLYTKKSIEFMKTNTPCSVSLPHMLFAEQRLFSMCAKKLGLKIYDFCSLDTLFSEKNKTFTHLWGHKETLRKNPVLKKQYLENCILRITSEFPSHSDLVSALRDLLQ